MASSIYRRFDLIKGFQHPDPPTGMDAMRGHPTSPGPRDPQIARMGAESPGNGMPGVPRVRFRDGYSHGPGIPGPTPTGPTQPGISYGEGIYKVED